MAPLLREALYDEVYVRLHGAEAARKLLELVPVLESAYTTELRRHPFLAAARAGLMSEAEIVFFSAHADMKSYYATGEQKRGAGSGPMSLVIGFALSAVLFVSVSWVAVKQGWIGSEEEGYGVLGA